MKKNIFLIAHIAINIVIFVICLYFFFNPLKLVGQEYALAIDGIIVVKAIVFVFMLYVILCVSNLFYEHIKRK